MRGMLSVLVLSAALSLGGCGGDDVDGDLEGQPTTGNIKVPTGQGLFVARFDPSNQVVPFPTDLLFSGTTDGTLNLPLAGDATDATVSALNALDGFSTVAPITTSFSGPIDPATVSGQTVLMYEAGNAGLVNGYAVTGVTSALTYGVDYIASVASTDTSGSTLSILPLRPLRPKTTYLLAITSGLRDTSGIPASSDTVYALSSYPQPLFQDGDSILPDSQLPDALAQTLDATLRPLVNAQRAALAGAGVDTTTVAFSWSFTTQSVGDVLSAVQAISTPADPTLALQDSTADSPFGAADIYVGTLQVPYYLAPAEGANDPTPLATTWTAANPAFDGDNERNLTAFNPLPALNSTQTIPVIASIPKAGAAPYPTVIYQHGITTNRATLLAIADSLASAGFAAIAIDLPLHGLTGNETNGTAAFRIPGSERLFDLDLVTQDANGSIIAAAPDGVIDSSGRHFINLSSLLTSRDNLRQAVSDLFTLYNALDNAIGVDFDESRVFFLGHSLGGIVGTTFLALNTGVQDAVLAMPGGGIAKLLDGSAAFGPEIAAGLAAAAGLQKATADYERFFLIAQTAIDSADPINYAATTAARGQGVLTFEVVGDGAGNLPDQVIPNHVGTLANGFLDAPAGTVPGPLSGTDPLLAEMAATQVGSTSVGTDQVAVIRFTAGHHGSILSPNDAAGNPDATSAAVTNVMQTSAATFFASGGSVVSVDTTPSDTATAEALVEQP